MSPACPKYRKTTIILISSVCRTLLRKKRPVDIEATNCELTRLEKELAEVVANGWLLEGIGYIMEKP